MVIPGPSDCSFVRADSDPWSGNCPSQTTAQLCLPKTVRRLA